MKMVLMRKILTPISSIGELYLDGEFECVTLEDPVRDKKIKGETAIPAGDYEVRIEKSPKFARDMPHLIDVPKFAGILIHWGNTAKDTKGCILVGSSKAKNAVAGSKVTFDKLFAKLRAAKDKGAPLSITIKNP